MMFHTYRNSLQEDNENKETLCVTNEPSMFWSSNQKLGLSVIESDDSSFLFMLEKILEIWGNKGGIVYFARSSTRVTGSMWLICNKCEKRGQFVRGCASTLIVLESQRIAFLFCKCYRSSIFFVPIMPKMKTVTNKQTNRQINTILQRKDSQIISCLLMKKKLVGETKNNEGSSLSPDLVCAIERC